MFFVRNVPVVVEPGVGAVEAEVVVADNSKRPKLFPVQLFRVALDSTNLPVLPFIPTTRAAHVFSLTHNPEESVALVVYDSLGRLSVLYVRDETGKAWEKKDVTAEHAGAAVTQFSVRFNFNSSKTRDQFMTAVDGIISKIQTGVKPSRVELEAPFAVLSRQRAAPVVLPIAVAKKDLKPVRL